LLAVRVQTSKGVHKGKVCYKGGWPGPSGWVDDTLGIQGGETAIEVSEEHEMRVRLKKWA
jgi:hypothetical protein